MLVLSRKTDESVYVGNEIVIRVIKIKGNVVRLGIEAPTNIKIMRTELLQTEKDVLESDSNNQQSTTSSNFTIAG